ncbi:hypothetical protein H8L32_23770 [Undibacterium sp. CY18W]|uniref:Uncharacterized protein n=1 Tax=Undibacterium hunanense TaxID=2762292 RepID=A0ABR6ZXB7_9BURK|nr:hypothetical protein [Undibacterium hunanense]MBC3920503.1 hypothetical protein [Undibacterium hunanense]
MTKLTDPPLKNTLIEYLNSIDSNANMLEFHKTDPVVAMTNFGLSNVEQAALLSGNRVVVATVVGISTDAGIALDSIEIFPNPNPV